MTTPTTIPTVGAAAPEQRPLVIERFLREREGVWRQVAAEDGLGGLTRQMLASSAVSLACYGAVVGFAHSPWQALSSALKLPTLFLLTLAICLPTLYLFNLVVGGRLSARQVLALALSAITVSSALILAFAPVTLFFMVTARSYEFFVLLNVAILGLAGAVGLRFMSQGTAFLNRDPEGEGAPPRVKPSLLRGWLLLYAFVGTQLGWTLRPFFGFPAEPFVVFRPVESNFYAGVLELLVNMLGGMGRAY